MQDGQAGIRLWDECVRLGIDARKGILERCSLLRPFIPHTVRGKPWESYSTEDISKDISFFKFEPDAAWHAFKGYSEGQYFVDPNKFMLTTPGVNAQSGSYEDFGIPAAILAHYLRGCNIIPEKNDFNSILFLMTPAETKEKMDALVAQLVRFEELIGKNADISEVLPHIYRQNEERYSGYKILDLCQEMHDFYKSNDAKGYQEKLFRRAYLPKRVMSPFEANTEFVRNQTKLVPIRNILDEVALEGALPYPPGILCVVPGEVWNDVAQRYFLILEEGINKFPGFAPEIHGVHFRNEDGRTIAYGFVHRRREKE
jgi:ornithine decarboxylase